MTLANTNQIGKQVYRQWSDWYEVYFVERITKKFVFVRGFMEDHSIRLDRQSLERRGKTHSWRHSAVFVTEMPEEYRRTTIGYLLNCEPREILGLPEKFTKEELTAAYRKLAKENHPDRNIGDPTASERFRKIQSAYEHLENHEQA